MNGFVIQKTAFPFIVMIIDDASTDGQQSLITAYMTRSFDMEGNTARRIETEYAEIFHARHKTNSNCYFTVLFLKENHYQKELHYKKLEYLSQWRDSVTYESLCEGDDWWTDPYKLQKQVDFMELHPDYSLCCTTYGSMRMKDGFVKNEKGVETDITLRQLMKKNLIGTLTVMYRKELHQEYMEQVLPVMPKFRMGDIPLWLFMASKGKIRKLADQTAMYRKLEYSASHSDDFDRQLEFLLDASRIRLWMNGYLAAGYALYLKMIMYSDVFSFCRKWSRSHGGRMTDLWKKAIKHI